MVDKRLCTEERKQIRIQMERVIGRKPLDPEVRETLIKELEDWRDKLIEARDAK